MGDPTLREEALSFLVALRANRSGNTATTYAIALTQFLEFMATKHPDSIHPRDVTTRMIEEWLEGNHHWSSATRHLKYWAVSGLFRRLRKHKVITENPCENVELPTVEHRLRTKIGREDSRRLWATTKTPTERLVLALLELGGLRCCEVTGANIEDVDWENGGLLVHGKGKKEREVPLGEMTLAHLRDHLGGNPATEGPVLRRKKGEPWGNKRVWAMVKRLCLRAGLNGSISPHILRHTFGSGMADETSIVNVSESMGHANLGATAPYMHGDWAAKKAAIERLATSLT